MNKFQTISYRLIKALLTFTLLFSFVEITAQIPKEFDKYLQKTDTTNLYWQVDKNPSFKGGYESLVNFYQKHFVYPRDSRKNGIEGIVHVLFIVETNGEITNVVATNSVDGYLEKEAVKFIKKMPKWIPGEKDGRKVRVLNIQPVKFSLKD